MPFRAQKLIYTSAIWLHLYQFFHSNLWAFDCSCRFLFSHLSGKQLSFFPWKECQKPHNWPRYQTFSRELLVALQVNPSSSGHSGDIQNPDMPLSGVTFHSKSWLTKPPINGMSYWLYVKKPYVISQVFRMTNSALAGVAQWIECRLQTKESLVWFPVRAHAWVPGWVSSGGQVRANHTLMFCSMSFSLPPPFSKNK